MGRLRRQRDCIGLVLAWAIALHAAVLGFTSATHAAMAAQGLDAPIICTKGGLKQTPQPKRHQHCCECCLTACRTACGAAKAFLPEQGLSPLPPADFVWLTRRETVATGPKAADRSAAQPRAPPSV